MEGLPTACAIELHLDRPTWIPGETLRGTVRLHLTASPSRHSFTRTHAATDGSSAPLSATAADEQNLPFWHSFLRAHQYLTLKVCGKEKGIVKDGPTSNMRRFMTNETVRYFKQDVRIDLLAAAHRVAAASATSAASAPRSEPASPSDPRVSPNAHTFSFEAPFEVLLPATLPPSTCCETYLTACSTRYRVTVRPWSGLAAVQRAGSGDKAGTHRVSPILQDALSSKSSSDGSVGPLANAGAARATARREGPDPQSRVFYVLSAVRYEEWDAARRVPRLMMPSPEPSPYMYRTLAERLVKRVSRRERAKHLMNSGAVACEVRVLPWILALREHVGSRAHAGTKPGSPLTGDAFGAGHATKPLSSGWKDGGEKVEGAAHGGDDGDDGDDEAELNGARLPPTVAHQRGDRGVDTGSPTAAACSRKPVPLKPSPEAENTAPPRSPPSRSVSLEVRSPSEAPTAPSRRQSCGDHTATHGEGETPKTSAERQVFPPRHRDPAFSPPSLSPPPSGSSDMNAVIDDSSPFPPLLALPLPKAYNKSFTVRVGLRNIFFDKPIEAIRVRLLQCRDANIYRMKSNNVSTLAYADYYIAYPPAVTRTAAATTAQGEAHRSSSPAKSAAEATTPTSPLVAPTQAFPFPYGLHPGESIVMDVNLELPQGDLRLGEDFSSTLPLPTIQTRMLRSETALDVLLIRRRPVRSSAASRSGSLEDPNPWYIEPELERSRLFYCECPVHLAAVVDRRNEVPPLPQVFTEELVRAEPLCL